MVSRHFKIHPNLMTESCLSKTYLPSLLQWLRVLLSVLEFLRMLLLTFIFVGQIAYQYKVIEKKIPLVVVLVDFDI